MDVRAEPARAGARRRHAGDGDVVIELRSDEGRALVWLYAADVARFLDRTERIVATGAERIDLDRVTRELLKAER